MSRGLILLLFSFVLIGTGGWFTYSMFVEGPVVGVIEEPVPECDSCSARHKAYAKAKKSWTKQGKTAVGDAVLPKLLPDE